MVVHIDWLTVSQAHPDAPEWGSVRQVDIDVDTGELECERLVGDQVAGSWDTSLRVRSAGGRVEVSGNPSKWGRLDAVVGLGTVEACLEVYNSVLRELGLPPFEDRGEVVTVQRQDVGGERYRDCPRISRIDLCRNLVVGGSSVRPVLDWYEAQTWGQRQPFRRVADTSVAAGSRGRRQWVLYAKGPELLAHRGSWARRRSMQREEAVAYLEALGQWATTAGVVRSEVRLGKRWLAESELKWASEWGVGMAEKIWNEQTTLDAGQAGAVSDYSDGAYSALLAAGVSERLAGQVVARLSLWLAGQPWRQGLGQATAYRYAKLCRECLGVDLRRPSNVRSLALSVRPRVIEARELTAADLPDWYRWPDRAAA